MRIDPITFEILKNRLTAINEEAAATIRLVTGSPVANEAYDYNTGILNSSGDILVIGSYIAIHAVTLQEVVKKIISEYWENPGIFPDDMFICNNPYDGAIHQNDVALVAPIHYKDELIAWTGAAIHQIDVGGPGGGQVSIGAKSIFEEAPVMPPIKIIERGTLRKDIEKNYLIRSRFPNLLGLDLRAKIAGNNVTKKRIIELIEKYGAEQVKGVISEIIDYTEKLFRARLQELPDGTWRHRSYLDYEGKIYPGYLSMTKEGDRLIFDFKGTAKQAPAVVNCPHAGLMAGVLIIILAYLCFDIPWCPAGVMRAVEISSEPGTLVHASWPAGVCKSTTAGNWIVQNLASTVLAKMLAASDRYRDRTMCLWMGSPSVEELFGVDQRGAIFGATLLDAMAGGTGARSYKDGIDTGGFMSAVSCAIANVETYESRYPILYLARRQRKDSGGAGKFRGGVGLELMYIPHGVDMIPTKIMHCFGVEEPESVGISGGYPGGSKNFLIKRNTNIRDLLEKGIVPQDHNEVEGTLEVEPAIIASYQGGQDLFIDMMVGGGGYGDPIERDSGLVERDVINGLVSLEAARDYYGVIIDQASKKVDEEKTILRRNKIREERRRERKAYELS